MTDWFLPTIILFPFAAWMFWGVGIPWALALLPCEMWRARVTVLAVGMALGPLVFTAWMFVLGTFGRITLAGALAGSGVLAGVGAIIAWRRSYSYRRAAPQVDENRWSSTPPGAASTGLSTRSALKDAANQGRSRSFRYRAGSLHGPAGRGCRPCYFQGSAGVLLAGLIALLIANVIVTAYWPFIAYDTQWVYGYDARIFVRDEHIPDEMGYYPQLIPLSYTYMQQAWGLTHASAINDHAARVVVPWFNAASVLMAYVLGWIAFGRRRVALLTAAVWAFYPHAAAWAGAGDLEITLTLYVTGAAAFFIAAWRSGSARLAVLSGVLLSGALWTKPTGGALALGVILAVVGYGVWVVANRFATEGTKYTEKKKKRFSLLFLNLRVLCDLCGESGLWPKLRVALIAGLASVPLGGMWYARNLALGHTPVEFPASYWHNFAQRSGQEFGWPLLIAALAAGGLLISSRRGRACPAQGVASSAPTGVRLLPLLALILLLIGILPTALNPRVIVQGDNIWRWVRGDLFAARRLNPLEAGLIAAGFALLMWSGRGVWRAWPRERRETVLLIWALLLPYGIVWFFDFSYHYRLSFAIVPLLAVQVAALIDGWLWDRLAARRIGRAVGALVLVTVIGVALAAALQHTVNVWRDGGLPDDTAKYDEGNPALMVVVHALEDYAAAHGQPVVAIPGEDRLPFFFLDWDIRNSRAPGDIPTSVEDLGDADIYVENSSGTFLMQRYGKWPNSLSADAAVGTTYYENKVFGWDGEPWPTVLQPIPIGLWGGVPVDDGNFRYSMFTIHPDARATPMNPAAKRDDTAIFGGFAQFIGFDVVSLRWVHHERVVLTLYWRPTDQAPPPRDYSVYIHLLTPDGQQIAQWDGVPLQKAYPTRFWRPGESLLDYWVLRMPSEVIKGPAQLQIGLYDPITNDRLPVTVNGAAVGDGLTIDTRIQVR
jgi:hypothetical protein